MKKNQYPADEQKLMDEIGDMGANLRSKNFSIVDRAAYQNRIWAKQKELQMLQGKRFNAANRD